MERKGLTIPTSVEIRCLNGREGCAIPSVGVVHGLPMSMTRGGASRGCIVVWSTLF